MFNFGKLKMRVYFTWCGETVISGGKFKCWRIRERWRKSGDWNEMSQVASTPACAWSSQELGEFVPSRYLHFSIPSSAVPNIGECILYLFANLLFIAGGRSGPGRWLSWELGCWLFIKHVHWYLSYNIRSIVAPLIPRINSDTPHSRTFLEEDISGYYFHGYFSGF